MHPSIVEYTASLVGIVVRFRFCARFLTDVYRDIHRPGGQVLDRLGDDFEWLSAISAICGTR